MSWLAAAAFAQFAAGGLKASALKRQQYKEADEDEYYADQIMRNYYKNVQRKRTSLTRYVTDRADEGGQMFGEVARAGDRAVGKVVSAVSASGAVVGEVTTQDIEMEQAFDAWYAQQQVTQDTYSDIDTAETAYTNWKDTEYEQSTMMYHNLMRSAQLKRRGADDMFMSNMMSSMFNAGGTYAAGKAQA